MTGWTKALGNPEGLLAVYEGVPPELTGVSVHELTIGRDGPSVTVTFDLPGPANPPAKWARAGFDTVQVRLRLFGVADLELRGISTDPVADLELTAGDPVRLEITSPDLTLRVVAAFADVAGFSAYRRGAPR
ncbi:Imm50 family immunity protein [Actinoplanes sp. URMC 104]|uniref:Imm50 family immunity protein n=1 Tax=Actinoplanes sp. URMC 104 TaxID=3423409 RepID=UPI003F197772